MLLPAVPPNPLSSLCLRGLRLEFPMHLPPTCSVHNACPSPPCQVVMRGLRPKFPVHAPPAYIQLAQSCWSGSPQLRPTFEECVVMLNNMLQVGCC